jgi:hypothetical protein
MMTVAAIDRLVHHANLIEIRSDSYRRKAAMRQMDREQTAAMPTATPPTDKASSN